MNKIIVQLSAKGLLKPAINVEKRVEEETLSLQRCLKRKGYLGLYDIAIRYSFLIVLAEGYDITVDKVHPAFAKIPLMIGELNDSNVEKIVFARHQCKHAYAAPPSHLFTILERGLANLQNYHAIQNASQKA